MKRIMDLINGKNDFSDFSLIDWFTLAIGVIRLLMELLESDGNGGSKLKDN